MNHSSPNFKKSGDDLSKGQSDLIIQRLDIIDQRIDLLQHSLNKAILELDAIRDSIIDHQRTKTFNSDKNVTKNPSKTNVENLIRKSMEEYVQNGPMKKKIQQDIEKSLHSIVSQSFEKIVAKKSHLLKDLEKTGDNIVTSKSESPITKAVHKEIKQNIPSRRQPQLAQSSSYENELKITSASRNDPCPLSYFKSNRYFEDAPQLSPMIWPNHHNVIPNNRPLELNPNDYLPPSLRNRNNFTSSIGDSIAANMELRSGQGINRELNNQPTMTSFNPFTSLGNRNTLSDVGDPYSNLNRNNKFSLLKMAMDLESARNTFNRSQAEKK